MWRWIMNLQLLNLTEVNIIICVDLIKNLLIKNFTKKCREFFRHMKTQRQSHLKEFTKLIKPTVRTNNERKIKMGAREAFRIFIRFQMKQMVDEKALDVSEEQIEEFANDIEDDPDFYENLNEFLEQEIYDYGENNGFWY